MPPNRKRIARGRAVYELELDHLTISEKIALMRSWHPGCSAPTRWRTWEEYFRDSDALRDQLLADKTIQHIYPGMEIFADRLRRGLAAMPGAVYDSHNHPPPYPYPALWHAHVHYPGHVHDDPPQMDSGGDVPPAGKRARRVPVTA